ncbi:MAG: hypothetical protein WA435_09770 [Gallionellaceae bacterium]
MKTNEKKQRNIGIAHTGSREAVETAIELSKGQKSLTWERLSKQGNSRIKRGDNDSEGLQEQERTAA